VRTLVQSLSARGADIRLLTVYILEAHPSDGWTLDCNEGEGVCYRQPRTLTQRLRVARQFAEQYEVPAGELVVDGMDNALDLLFEARPERLYVLRGGRVAFRSGVGPYQYSVPALSAFLHDTLQLA
jgi:Iodothyronine deiodinase